VSTATILIMAVIVRQRTGFVHIAFFCGDAGGACR
jgi:hypothetical protein